MNENIYLIYKFISPSGKGYIGQTKNYIHRCYEHQKSSSGCTAFKRAIDKYDWDNFTHEILEKDLTLEEANIREVYWIEFHNTLAPNGYNLTTGGLNHKLSDETKQKMKDNHPDVNGENNPMWGYEWSEEQRENHSRFMTGRNGELNGMYGRTGENAICFGRVGDLHRRAAWMPTDPPVRLRSDSGASNARAD
jgi:group I intron endonuclease